MLQNAMAGSFRIFRVFGITVYLHWAWLLLAMFELQSNSSYSSSTWNLLEYVGIFVIVTLHEFGHALACRSVGGQADTIVLWPLGGVAFVQPPQRPGAVLWSIVAGPLVNVILIPIFLGLDFAMAGGNGTTDMQLLAHRMFIFNIIILAFNLLPIYPLDGGQILQSLLWFVIGRAKSLKIVAVIGLIAAGLGVLWALSHGRLWLVVMALFIGWQSWAGFRAAIVMAEEDRRLRDVIDAKYSRLNTDDDPRR